MNPPTAGEHLTVVGAGGYVGSRLLELASRYRHVTAVGRYRRLTAVGRYGGTAWIGFDDLLRQLNERRNPPGVIVWLLAGDRHNELQHIEQLLDAAAGMDFRLVYASSCAVYGRADTPCREEDPPDPQDTYALTKLISEHAALSSGQRTCALRLATLHGHQAAGATKQAVHRLIHQAADGNVDLYGAGNWRPFLHRDIAVASILTAADTPGLTGVFNIAQDHATFDDIAEYAAAAFGATITRSEKPETRSYRVDTTLAEQTGLLTARPGAGLWASMDAYAKALSHLLDAPVP